ncbi:MAG: hypothetical protein N4A59_06160 [Marinifilum sp.]|jgi:hypothetical protein|nr:hypothetical protein [Marinifilum sp.]
MKTNEIKKEAVKTLNEVIEFNAKVNDSLVSIIEDYIEFVQENVPSGYKNYFGVGKAADHSQFGAVWGFEVYCEYGEGYYYACCGDSYYFGNDFNSRVSGSNFEQMKNFAAKIPDYIKKGMEELLKDTEDADEITKKLENLF